MGWILLLFYIMQSQSAGEMNCSFESEREINHYTEQKESKLPAGHEDVEEDACTDYMIMPDRDIILEQSEEKVMFREDMPKAWQICDMVEKKADF